MGRHQKVKPSQAAPADLPLSEEQIAEFREAFRLFDVDGDGHITAEELGIVLQTLGQKTTPEDIQQMILEVDKDGNNQIEFEEFCMLMCKSMNKAEDEQTLREAFSLLDRDGSGTIDFSELKEILTGFSKAGETLDDEEIDELLKMSDVGGDGAINFDEFVSVMMKEES